MDDSRMLCLCALQACGCPNQHIQAMNANPEASIGTPAEGTEVLEGQLVAFQGYVRDPDNAVGDLQASWSLGAQEICPPSPPGDDWLCSCEATVPPERKT